jgi:hypothetical protein
LMRATPRAGKPMNGRAASTVMNSGRHSIRS